MPRLCSSRFYIKYDVSCELTGFCLFFYFQNSWRRRSREKNNRKNGGVSSLPSKCCCLFVERNGGVGEVEEG